MSLLGRMVSSFEAIPYAQFHSRALQQNILSAWSRKMQALDSCMIITPKARGSLVWWLVDQNLIQGRSLLPLSWKVVTTDASLSGWGAVMESSTVQRKWTLKEQGLPINALELWAICLALNYWTSKSYGVTQ